MQLIHDKECSTSQDWTRFPRPTPSGTVWLRWVVQPKDNWVLLTVRTKRAHHRGSASLCWPVAATLLSTQKFYPSSLTLAVQ